MSLEDSGITKTTKPMHILSSFLFTGTFMMPIKQVSKIPCDLIKIVYMMLQPMELFGVDNRGSNIVCLVLLIKMED